MIFQKEKLYCQYCKSNLTCNCENEMILAKLSADLSDFYDINDSPILEDYLTSERDDLTNQQHIDRILLFHELFIKSIKHFYKTDRIKRDYIELSLCSLIYQDFMSEFWFNFMDHYKPHPPETK